MLALAVFSNWPLRELDIECASLHGDLKEEVFISQPQCYVDKNYPTHVCTIIKSIYGLRQAPRAWYENFANRLLELGFCISASNQSLFVFIKDTIKIYLLLYVDDIILTGNDATFINDLIVSLSSTFKMKDMGALSYFLGINVTRSSAGLVLDQSKYILKLLEKSDIVGAKPMASPANSVKLHHNNGTCLSDPTLYGSLVGAFQYVTLTRPDIAYSVNQACQFLQMDSVSF